jgi:hypothetical protein
MSATQCELDRRLGRLVPCPGSRCAFWVGTQCVLGGLRADWDANPSLAVMLHRLRNELDPSWDRSFVPPGLRD